MDKMRLITIKNIYHLTALILVLPLFYMNIFFSIAFMSCDPLTPETVSVSIKIYINKDNNGKKLTNVHIFSNSSVNFYTIMSSDSEISNISTIVTI